MSILNNIESVEYDKNRDKKFNLKSGIIWGHMSNKCFPLLYLTKPKSVSQKDFEIILNKLQIKMLR